jgi:Putative transposase
VQKLYSKWLVISGISAPRSASSACCTPGTRKLQIHPHVHCVIPAGGLSLDHTHWIKLDFTGENSTRAAVIHYQENKIRCLTADLEAEAAALECHHGGCAPRPAEIWALAAGHRSPPITSANNECCFQDGREDDHTISLVRQALRDVVGNIENLLQHNAAVLEPILILFLISCQSWRGKNWQSHEIKRSSDT